MKNAEYSISSLAEYSIGSKNNNSDRFQGDYLLHQHFNYAMSADEVKALDNNGDPMGYVVPKESRYFEKRYQSDLRMELMDGEVPMVLIIYLLCQMVAFWSCRGIMMLIKL